MDATEALLTRHSSPRVTDPGPTDDQLNLLFKAALRAPDHARLKPWRFLVVKQEARGKLGKVFAEAMQAESEVELSTDELQKYKELPMRAPVIIIPICCIKEHKNVPEIEQYLSLAAAVESLLIMAFSQGLGAYWRTGKPCYSNYVTKELGVKSDERLCGFIYVGTAVKSSRLSTENSVADFVSEWF